MTDKNISSSFTDYAKSVAGYSRFLQFMVSAEIQLRYRRSYFGILWHLLVPAVQIAVVAVVFKSLMGGSSGTDFVFFLMPGITLWNFMSQSLREGAVSIISSGRILRARPIPIVVFPLVKTLSSVSVLLLLLTLIGAVVVASGQNHPSHLFLALVGTAVAILLTCSLSVICGIVTVFMRDFAAILEIALSLAFFATPIIYGPQQLPPVIRRLIEINPLTYYIGIVRGPLIGRDIPSIHVYAMCALCAALSVGVSVWLGSMTQDRAVYRVE